MNKSWQPKKIREFSYPKKASKIMDEWFLEYASLYDIQEATNIARTTLYRWRRWIKEDGKSLQDLMSVTDYKKCVELEIKDWKEATEKREEAKKINDSLSKQAKDLKAQLAAQGYEVTIKAPKVNKEAKKIADFKQILVLQSDKDAKKVNQGKTMFNKLSDEDKKAYLEYRRKHSNE